MKSFPKGQGQSTNVQIQVQRFLGEQEDLVVFGPGRGAGYAKRPPAHGSSQRFELSGVIKMNRCINRPRMMLKPKPSLEFFFVLTLSSKLFAFHAYGGKDKLLFFLKG